MLELIVGSYNFVDELAPKVGGKFVPIYLDVPFVSYLAALQKVHIVQELLLPISLHLEFHDR